MTRHLGGISLLAIIAVAGLSVWVSMLAGEVRTLKGDQARRLNQNSSALDSAHRQV